MHVFISRQCEHVINQRVGDARHIQRRSEQNWSFDFTEFVDLGRAGKFPERVADENRARNLLAEKISVVRQNRGDSCPHIVATNQRLVTDRNTTYVGDGVQRSRLKHANNDACFASAWPRFLLWGCLSHDQNRSQQY